jgi:hypothetical protein
VTVRAQARRELGLDQPREHFLSAIAAGAFSGTPPSPRRLRIRRLTGNSVSSLTWNFASPDGRATFQLEKAEDGDPVLVWRRIGASTGPVTSVRLAWAGWAGMTRRCQDGRRDGHD